MQMLIIYVIVGSIASPLVGLVLRIERRLFMRSDSLGATYVRTYFRPTASAVGTHIEDLSDEEVGHLHLKWNSLLSPIPMVLYGSTAATWGYLR
jgi:hypothetical protein